MLAALNGLFVLNRVKIFIFFSLIATYVYLYAKCIYSMRHALPNCRLSQLKLTSASSRWSLAHVLPHWQPIIQDTLAAQLARTREKIPAIKIDFHPNKDPRTAYNSSKLAIMIEARAFPHLVPQIHHMMTVVPPDWRFLFIGSNNSVALVGKAVGTKYQQAAGKLDLMIAPEPWSIEDREQVWRMLTDIRFYDELLPGVEWLLKFESDSILCSNSETSLNDWLDFDWAGSPRLASLKILGLQHSMALDLVIMTNLCRTPDDWFAGNGGLSIRRISAIRRVLRIQERENNSMPEDEWFGKRVISVPGLKVATGEMEDHFSVEEIYHEKPMGYHLRSGNGHLPGGVWKNRDQRKAILKYCPEIAIILDMKLEKERCSGDNGEGELSDMPRRAAEAEAAPERKRSSIFGDMSIDFDATVLRG
jgi:hypothetical protein